MSQAGGKKRSRQQEQEGKPPSRATSPRPPGKKSKDAPSERSRVFKNSQSLTQELDIRNHSDLRKLNWTVMAVPTFSPPDEFGAKLQGCNRHALQIVIFKYETSISVAGEEKKVKTTLDTMVPSSMKTIGFLTRPAEPIDSKEKQE